MTGRNPVKGRLSPPHKPKAFTDEEVRQIREERAAGIAVRELAARYGVHPVTIRQLIRGDSYGWVR